MANKMPTLTDIVFPDQAFYEHFLQRLRIVMAHKTPVLRVSEIREGPKPKSAGEFPSVEVVVQIQGLKLKNPVTGQPLLSEQRLKEYFERWSSQEGFLLWLSEYVADSIPPHSLDARLKKKFLAIKTGRPGRLPTRSDLKVFHDGVVHHLKAVRQWLQERKGRYSSKQDIRDFLAVADPNIFWWAYLVRNGKISLDQIAEGTAENMAKVILAEHWEVSEESVRSRLFRKE